jgi:hypothetical protein
MAALRDDAVWRAAVKIQTEHYPHGQLKCFGEPMLHSVGPAELALAGIEAVHYSYPEFSFNQNQGEEEMRKLLLIALSLFVSGSVALAQSKVDTTWHCPKATTEHKLEVGDVPDRVYYIGQGTCDATKSTGDLKEKNGTFTEFHDQWKAKFNFHGYYIATTDDGDKVSYMYEGSATTDATKPLANKWKIVSGTGKHKSMKGSGTCAGKAVGDAFEWECTGTYSMGMAKAN